MSNLGTFVRGLRSSAGINVSLRRFARAYGFGGAAPTAAKPGGRPVGMLGAKAIARKLDEFEARDRAQLERTRPPPLDLGDDDPTPTPEST